MTMHFAGWGEIGDGLADAAVYEGNSLVLASLKGSAWAAKPASLYTGADQLINHYDLLFFRMKSPNQADPIFNKYSVTEYKGYRVTPAGGVGVGVGTLDGDGYPASSGEHGELLLPGHPITLPWGAYFLVICAVHLAWVYDSEEEAESIKLDNAGLVGTDYPSWPLYHYAFDSTPAEGVMTPFHIKTTTGMWDWGVGNVCQHGMISVPHEPEGGTPNEWVSGGEIVGFRVNRKDWVS